MVAATKMGSGHRRRVAASSSRRNHKKQTHLPSKIQMIASEYKEEEIVEALSQFLPPSTSTKRHVVDVGARCCSNSHSGSVSHWLLENSIHQPKEQPWSGVMIQPDSHFYKELRQLHDPMGNRCLQITPSSREGLNERSLVWILRQFASSLPRDFDFLCLSEGTRWNNYWILRDFLECQTYKPRLICAPFDSSFPNDVAYVPPRSDKSGVPSMLALVGIAKEFKYQLVMTTARSAFFVPHKLYREHLRTPVKLPTANPSSPRHQQIQESRDQLGSSDRKALESSPKREIIDTEAYITAGRQWLAERRLHLERDESKRKKMTSSFKKQATSAWQQRKVSIIDSIKRQSAKRRHRIQEKRNSTVPLREARDPPENETKEKKSTELNIFTKSEGNAALAKAHKAATKDATPKRSNRRRPDPPAADDRVVLRPIQPQTVGLTAMARAEGAESIPSNLKAKETINPLQQKSKSVAECSQYFTETINRYRQELTDSPPPKDDAKELTHRVEASDEEEIVFSNHLEGSDEEENVFSNEEMREPPLADENRGRVIDMSAHFCDIGSQSEEDLELAVRHLVTRLRQEGYAFIRGTGVSRFVCHDALIASQLLLQEANEATRRSCTRGPHSSRGYSPLCTEHSGDSGLKDMVRKFRLGSKSSRDQNVWPIDGFMDDETQEYIRTSLQNYHDEVQDVAQILIENVCDGLSIENKYFDPVAGYSSLGTEASSTSLLTAVSCSCGSRHIADKPIVASYEDPSIISVFLVDDGNCGEFQHRDVNGRWKPVEFPPSASNDPTFVVYVGETLRHLTRGFLPSLSRRVVPSKGHQSMNALFLSISRSTNNSSREAVDPFMCWDSSFNPTIKARDDCRVDSDSEDEEEGVLQKMALEKLASQLREADRAFQITHGEEDGENDVQAVLDLASKLMQPSPRHQTQCTKDYFSWFDPQKMLSKEDNHHASTPVSGLQTVVQRCRSPSEGSVGLPLPSSEALGRTESSAEKTARQTLRTMNPFRVARNKLLEKKSATSEDRKRSQELSKLLPSKVPNLVSHSSSNQALKEGKIRRLPAHPDKQCLTRQSFIGDSSGANTENAFEDSRHQESTGRQRVNEKELGPGSPTYPILIDYQVESSSSQESNGRAQWTGQQTTSSDINSTNSFSSHRVKTESTNLSQPNLATMLLVNPAWALTESISREDIQIDSVRAQNTPSRQRLDAINNTGSNPLSDKMQETAIHEKRRYFLPLGTKVASSVGTLHRSKHDGNPNQELSVKTKSTVVSMDDTVKQSEGAVSSFETIEASDVLDELLSADNENDTQYVFIKSEDAKATSPMEKHQSRDSYDVERRPSSADLHLSITRSKSTRDPPADAADRDSGSRLENSVSPSNSFLYDQTISFPQPKERVDTLNTKTMHGMSTDLSPSHPQQATSENVRTTQLAHVQTDDTHDEPLGTIDGKEGICNAGRLRQWQAEKIMLKNLHDLKWPHRTTTRREGEGASLSSVSELTDEGHKFGCHAQFPWM